MRHYNTGDRFACIWVDLESAREDPEPQSGMWTILQNLDEAVLRNLPGVAPPPWAPDGNPSTAVLHYLRELCRRVSRPLVVLFDEADGLVGRTMVAFLTQLRQGYLARTELPFAYSVALIGMRQVRDYALSRKDQHAVSWLGTTSPFNITAESSTLLPFTPEDVRELLGQHTTRTGQVFSEDAVERIFYLSQGHPWLVNAMADQIVNRDAEDRSVFITAAHVDAAKETIILQRRTHIDSLINKLREPRVRQIIEPMLMGRHLSGDVLDDDVAYLLGLGLCRIKNGVMEIANPIYKEVIPRALTFVKQISLGVEPAWYRRPDGKLDMPKLMREWQEFWREDGHLAAEGFAYQEAGPHLMMMAFLQRIINGGGRIEREYALGRGALDLLISFAGERHAIEVKLRRDTTTGVRALTQLLRYLDQAGLSQGWVVIFDLRKEVPWAEKLTTEEVEIEGKRIWVIGS